MKRNQPLTDEFINSISKNFTARNKTIWGKYNDIARTFREVSDLKDFIEKASDPGNYNNEQQERIESLRLTEVMDGFRMVAASIECAAGQIQLAATRFIFEHVSEERAETAPDAAYISALRTQINNLYTLMNNIHHDLHHDLQDFITGVLRLQ